MDLDPAYFPWESRSAFGEPSLGRMQRREASRVVRPRGIRSRALSAIVLVTSGKHPNTMQNEEKCSWHGYLYSRSVHHGK